MEDYTYYNDCVNAAIAERLIDLNRRFYQERGRDFSETRQRLQPGVVRILDSLQGNESLLDLGCGNGELARELSRRKHHAPYLGLDFSLPLLSEAGRKRISFPVRFQTADLAHLSMLPADETASQSHWSVVVAFSVLHHIPTRERRLDLLRQVHRWLKTRGMLVISNWQFAASPRLSERIQPWDALGLTADDVDPNDYLLDWRHGGLGLRYVHQFDEAELADLAKASGFAVTETFLSDGADRRSGLYQRWKRD
jgi:SAM-dependent methyltransferase